MSAQLKQVYGTDNLHSMSIIRVKSVNIFTHDFIKKLFLISLIQLQIKYHLFPV